MRKYLFVLVIILFSITMCKRTQSVNSNVENSISPGISFENIDIASENIITETFLDIEIDLTEIELLGINRANLFIGESDDNKFIGYIDLNNLNSDIKIGEVYIYEKYIVLEEFYNHNIGGFNIYEYNPNIKINEYPEFKQQVQRRPDKAF
jgi:hypothetical protein